MGLVTLLTSIIGTVSGGVTIIDALEKKFGKQSIEVQLYRVLDEALKELCEQKKWEHDPDAIGAFFRSNQIKTEAISDEEQLIEILEVSIGVPELITAELKEEWIDCFDRRLSTYPDLYRYLNRRNKPQRKTNPIVPQNLTTIPAPSELLGRDQTVSEIQEQLKSSNIVCIHADGGVGKTAVAAVVMDRIRIEVISGSDEFKHFAWITSQGNLIKDLAELNVPTTEVLHTDEEKLDKVKAFLQTAPTFLVLDNMDTKLESDDLALLNTISEKTKVLITSRIHQERINGYKLKELDPDTALAFFYNCYLGNNDHSLEELKAREDVEFVQKITKAATYNALFIELIGKTARWEYRNKLGNLWKSLKENIFNASSKIDIKGVHSSSHGLSESDLKLQNQISKLYALSDLPEKCQEIMNFMAQFPAETSVFDDLLDWAGFDINDLKWLTERAWIEQAEDGYLLHTVVRGSVWKQDIGFDIWKYENLIDKLGYTDEYMPITDGYLAIGKRLGPVKVICDLISESIGKRLEDFKGNISVLTDAGCLFNNMAYVCRAQGSYDDALKYYLKALEICEKVLGKDHPSTATAYDNLAGVYQGQGNYEDALKYYLKALEICEKVLGQDHPSTAATYNNLAGIFEDQGNYDDALNYYLKALEIWEKVHGQDHPDTATTYNNLAGVYQAQGNYDDALKYYLKALEICEKVLGKDHPSTATMYNNLAAVYQDQGNYDDALNYYLKALEISKKVFGQGHSLTATTYNNLANVYQEQGNYDDALKYYLKDLEIREKVLGQDHPSTATTYNNMAYVYRAQGSYDDALKYYLKAIEIGEKVFGQDHPLMVTIYNNLAGVYKDQCNYDDALKYCQKAIEISEKVLGQDHPSAAATYNNLAGVYYAQGNYEDALKYYQKALEICEKVLGQGHPSTGVTYNNLAGIYEDQGNYDDALKYYLKALEIRKNVLGKDHPSTATIYDNMGTLFYSMNRYEESMKYLRAALSIREKKLGPDHPYTRSTRESLEYVEKVINKQQS